ncbi:acyl-CoA dehydrogenase family protein [Streptomyces chromofuscus]|uniref:Acyl-CoA/acyl-ACP dehydrogenase n=1 Tax=Streptomyces chromofuscus TaxID=42881 RepID=A0A7M2T8L8_STRCW|nr:acyl-CoA dehydrogenase family protein [Streptomyces chromofuscus]QOV43761.1 acyl-CoA/acyl-ACP dehydrogenase [Streptomyces chromofuscus]GGT22158.1 acyl-CoA dehydrogenase [Streptomyces chromofuscus]
MEHPPYRLAEEFDRFLGDPDDPGEVFSYARCAELDDKEEFPAEICRRFEEWGLPDHYVPVEHGGRLRDYEHVLQLVRAVARRDLTCAVGHGKTYLGGVCVWVAGSAEQGARLGADIMAGVPVSLGLTERAHGSDLLAGDVHVGAGPSDADHWLVTGEKWLINNATRGSVLSLLTRTRPDGGPRGFSVLLVDKRELDEVTYRHLPKVRTHGIRGADISGIAFDGARVPRGALVGAEGAGLEIVLKALQLTRTMCAALSLGAGDHGLLLGLDFAERRELYGRRLVDLPQARQVLTGAAADVLLHEAVALVAARAVQAQTAELGIVSAVTKYLLPTGTDEVLADLTGLLGARAFLKGVHAEGRFQKLQRDHRIVGLFDGNTLVNLNSLVNQFRTLVRGFRRGTGDTAGAGTACDLAAPLPPLDPSKLSLVARHGSGLMAGLAASVEDVTRRAERNPALGPVAEAARRLLAVTTVVHTEMEEYQGVLTEVPPAAFEVARRYTLCWAGAACLGLWTRSAGHFRDDAATGPLWRDGLWLHTALDRLLVRLGEPAAAGRETHDELLGALRAARSSGRLFSLLTQRGPERRPATCDAAAGERETT